MKSLSLARVLPVLDTGAPPKLEARPELHLVPPVEIEEYAADFMSDPLPEAPAEPVVDRWQEGYEAGVAIGLAQAQAEAQAAAHAAAQDQSASIENAIAAARAQWVTEESDRIASGVLKALGVVESEICSVAERILAKVAAHSVRQRALGQFVQAVQTLLRDGEAGIVTVHAPGDLVAALNARLGSIASLEFVAHDAAEVWVRSGPTLIETRLGSWKSDLFGGEAA